MPSVTPAIPRNGLRARFRRLRRRVLVWSGHTLPPGTRVLAGLLLICGGLLGFLPILGFWMIPVGVVVASLDVVPAWRWLTRRPARGRPRQGPPPA